MEEFYPRGMTLIEIFLCFQINKGFVFGERHKFLLSFEIAFRLVYEVLHFQYFLVVNGVPVFAISEIAQLVR